MVRKTKGEEQRARSKGKNKLSDVRCTGAGIQVVREQFSVGRKAGSKGKEKYSGGIRSQ